MTRNVIYFSAFIFCSLIGPIGLTSDVFAQQSGKIEDLKARVSSLEEYHQSLQSAMNDFSKNLVGTVNQQLVVARSRAIVLNPLSKKMQRIDTNVGTLLISVQRMEKIDKGFRLFLQIGNPNAATYGDLKLRLYWGLPWDQKADASAYEKWRQSLTGAEYVYSGMIEAGMWTDLAIDIKPVEYNQLQYIECEMEINTVKLQKFKGVEGESLSPH